VWVALKDGRPNRNLVLMVRSCLSMETVRHLLVRSAFLDGNKGLPNLTIEGSKLEKRYNKKPQDSLTRTLRRKRRRRKKQKTQTNKKKKKKKTKQPMRGQSNSVPEKLLYRFVRASRRKQRRKSKKARESERCDRSEEEEMTKKACNRAELNILLTL